MAFRPTGETPCFVHANGDKAAVHVIYKLLDPTGVWCVTAWDAYAWASGS